MSKFLAASFTAGTAVVKYCDSGTTDMGMAARAVTSASLREMLSVICPGTSSLQVSVPQSPATFADFACRTLLAGRLKLFPATFGGQVEAAGMSIRQWQRCVDTSRGVTSGRTMCPAPGA